MAILDSGDRTEFETGAVRDMHAGKGRFDLLPWYGIFCVALRSEEGAIKYGERNVDKGIPQKSLIDSAFRHLVRYWYGETDEDHLAAAAWNILWAIENKKYHPEMIELPRTISADGLIKTAMDACDKLGKCELKIPCNMKEVEQIELPTILNWIIRTCG